ncbi:protein seele-like [Selaginella moellendorffii]|uniref:protein seele-like n=1 Tax=Selaginella moellendorffii TaxID=88036 RepID=UPI000D1C7B44|nr:protein seele-like [Selaginella moellendorffii]XP_024539034.1 protein seele-like [Selaginella moellendorffii]|eukprot:XP_024526693.1 protein seele-like [Selaginella moellendorffii]
MAAAIYRLLPLVGILLVLPMLIEAIHHKCAACKAVAVELELALANERPRNDIDLRHRLDSKGQRQGRVIQYKLSELRVLELLEGVCSRVKDYTLDKATGEWIKLSNSGNRNEDEKREAEVHSKEIAVYCGRLLEKHEDELASTIRSGEMVAGSVNTVLCNNISRDCNTEREEL